MTKAETEKTKPTGKQSNVTVGGGDMTDNWLKRQLKKAAEEVAKWPSWAIPPFEDEMIVDTSKWTETTLRKGTKRPKICRDMFITKYHDHWKYCVVKNSNLVTKINISEPVAMELINEHGLQSMKTTIFVHARTYRTPASNKLISRLLNNTSEAE